MMRLPTLLALSRNKAGTMAIETAIVAPVLILLSLGAFDASRMVARQSELQSAISEATSIVLASPPETVEQQDTLEQVIEASTGLAADEVTLTEVYRCGTDEDFVNDPSTCASSDLASTYIQLRITDTYTPQWTQFGIGGPMNYDIQRTVQMS